MKIKLNGQVTKIYDDINKGKFVLVVNTENKFGEITLYNVSRKDYAEISLNDNVEIELNTLCIYLEIDDIYTIDIRRKCTVYKGDLSFECYVEAPTYEVIKVAY